MPKKSYTRSPLLANQQIELDSIKLILKQLDSQNQTIIKHLSVLGTSLDELQKSVDTKVGEKIERLRQDFRNGLAALIAPSQDGDVKDIVKDFLFQQAKTRKPL